MYTSNKAFLRHYLICVPDSFLFENGRMIPLDHILERSVKLMLFLFSSIKYGKTLRGSVKRGLSGDGMGGTIFRRIYLNCYVHLVTPPVPESIY
jgi:hypothetical protein